MKILKTKHVKGEEYKEHEYKVRIESVKWNHTQKLLRII